MAIIMISTNCYGREKQIAEKVASELGYELVSEEILAEAAEQFGVSEKELTSAIDVGPSILDIFGDFACEKQKNVAYIQAALTKRLRKDDIVFHGLIGHLLIKGVGHALKAAIFSGLEDRLSYLMQRDNIEKKEALKIIKREDRRRSKWSEWLYGVDTWEPSLYDLVINMEEHPVDDVVDMICEAAQADRFRTTPRSRRALEDLNLAARVKARLLSVKPDIEVHAVDGAVVVHTEASLLQEETVRERMENAIADIDDVKALRVHVTPMTPFFDKESREGVARPAGTSQEGIAFAKAVGMMPGAEPAEHDDASGPRMTFDKVKVLKSEMTRQDAFAEKGVASMEADDDAGRARGRKSIHVMILDDEPIVGSRLKPALSKHGFEVETFVDPTQALKRLDEKEFDIIVTDLRMEEVDGIQVLEYVLNTRKNAKVILITGYATVEVAREALVKGAFDFIAKPFKPKDLRAVVTKAALSLGYDGVV